MKETMIFQKVVRSLPMRYDPMISSLEEREYIDTLMLAGLAVFTGQFSQFA
jgi:hypothetical protein